MHHPYNTAYRLGTPNLSVASSTIAGGVRHFSLTAEPIIQLLTNDITVNAWGYNGSSPGPVLVAHEGERVQIKVTNRLPVRTSIHWHGVIVPNDMDGVPEIGEGPFIDPEETFIYEFTLRQTGTYMYHSHIDPAHQEMMGLGGMFIVLPRLPCAGRNLGH